MSIMKIKGRIRDYDWGLSNESSLVYQFSKSEQKYNKYAELWMGTHISAPSLISSKKTLLEYFKQEKIQQLTYLFKILSIQKCLSIQSHPNKEQAQQLHKLFANLYPDSNDKPQFKCLIGFITNQQLSNLLKIQPFTNFKSKQIKNLLQQILLLTPQQIKSFVQTIILQKQNFKSRQNLIIKMNKQFPYDVGIIVSFLLQYRQIPAGCAYYIKAGQPHAYLQGQCLELMKNSDNVVRLGLTPKHKDTKTLLQILDYEDRNIEALKKQINCYKAGALKLFEIFENEEIQLNQASIGIVFEGEFLINGFKVINKDIFILFDKKVKIQGKGKLYLASSQ